MTIPFNRPFVVGKELHYISQAVLGGHLAGDGAFTHKCHAWMEERYEARRVLLTHSCTAALEMAAILSEVGPGDEVIMPSYTFVSTANAFAQRGCSIRFVDIREDTLNIDETLIESAINERTRAIVPVHYAGVSAEMGTILAVAEDHDLIVIEDAAQGVNATWRGRFLGTLGHLGTYSFHETKNFISGEGGALVVNDERFLERAEIIREKGTNRSKFLRGQVDKYTWVDLGSSYLPSELVAAFLFAQLEESEHITEVRNEVWSRYHDLLVPLEAQGLLRTPKCPPECVHNAHMYYVIVETPGLRDGLIAHLRRQGITAVFHYVPLHDSPQGRRLAVSNLPLPVTEDLSARLVRLPCFYGLTATEQACVVGEIERFLAPKQASHSRESAWSEPVGVGS